METAQRIASLVQRPYGPGFSAYLSYDTSLQSWGFQLPISGRVLSGKDLGEVYASFLEYSRESLTEKVVKVRHDLSEMEAHLIFILREKELTTNE
jgi:hypothetical protein